MGKKIILFSLSMLSVFALNAQNGRTFAVDFSSGSQIVDSRLETVPADVELVNGRYYRHLHFGSLPDYATRMQLEKEGISLLNFIAGTTYTASFRSDVKFPLSASYNVSGISRITAKSKMHSELSNALLNSDFPFYAIDGDRNIGITFTYYADIPHNVVLDSVYALPYKLSYHNGNSHRMTIWIPESEAAAFVDKPFVCAAELKDDAPQMDNNVGRTNHRDNWLAQDFPGGRMYNGAGVNVMLQDDGIIGPHIDYTGRLQNQYITFNSGDHGDHCAGIIMGGGNKDPLTRGMGWGADIHVYEAAPYQGYDSIYNHYFTNNILITSTSYSDGCNAGYTTLAQTLDQQIIDMPNLIHVFSAGNNGAADCGYGAGSTWGNVTGGHKHSKNSIAVGNLTHLDVLAASSSRGPAHDGRMKPEVCAVGTNVYSTSDVNDYVFKTGTSMSCPAVSGTFACLYQAYREINGTTPKSGLMKAILMNTCDDLGNAGPDYKFGYGRINGRKAIQPIEQNWFIIDSVGNSQTDVHTITVPANTGQLKVMIYWHDMPAAVNSTIALVNNLNMQVTAPSSTVYNPWILDYTPNASNLDAVAVRGVDIRNNHEQVTIDNPTPGTYSVSVNGAVVPMGPQTYYLVWYFEPAGELVLTYPNGAEGFVPAETEVIRWDAWGNTGTLTLEYTTDGTTWNPIASGIAAADRYYNWTVPAGMSGLCKVRITRSAVSDVSDVNFSIAQVPSGIYVAWSCPDSLCLKWTAVPGATGYDVFKLGSVYMDSIGSSPVDSFIVNGLNNYANTYWFSVRTIGPNQTVGRRAIAIEKLPGVLCAGPDASISSVSAPATDYYSCMSLVNVPVIAVISNPGTATVSNFPVSFSYDNGTPVTETFSGTLAPSGTATYTFTATVNIGAVGAHTLQVWCDLPNDIGSSNDTATSIINHLNSVAVTPAWLEDFESFPLCGTGSDCGATTCNMINGLTNIANGSGDDIDWRTAQGATPSSNTGPGTDYLPGSTTGNYLYLEASACFSQTSILMLPCIDLTVFSTPTFSFAYHMYGTDMGELHLDVYSNGAWTNDVWVQTGNQGNTWQLATVALNAYAGQVILMRFRGITGTNFTSDMAIDAIRLEDPTALGNTTSFTGLSVFPNPTEGVATVNISGLTESVVTADVYDVGGRLVRSAQHSVSGTATQFQVDLNGLATGTYFLKVHSGEMEETVRITKLD